MASIDGRMAPKYVPGSVQHYIASECDACRTVSPRETTVVLVDAKGPCVMTAGSAAPTLVEYCNERYAIARPSKPINLVNVEWGGGKHLFDRKSGACVEGFDGLMRGWRLHPFEVTANDDYHIGYAALPSAPIARVPLVCETLPATINEAT